MEIRFFKPEKPHGFLSNYFRWPFVLECRRWENVEHFYQAAKFSHDSKLTEAICRHSHPDAAKSFSREHASDCRSDWENGGCRRISGEFTNFLSEIGSHGSLILFVTSSIDRIF